MLGRVCRWLGAPACAFEKEGFFLLLLAALKFWIAYISGFEGHTFQPALATHPIPHPLYAGTQGC